MVWIECHGCCVLRPLQEGTHHKLLRNLDSACKVANWIIVDIFEYLYYPARAVQAGLVSIYRCVYICVCGRKNI